jgi:hypothetical protein
VQTPEGREKAAIDRYLKQTGAWFCSPATFGYGRSGVPDRVGCHRGADGIGRFFSIEVKREGKEPTALQRRRLKEVSEAGGLAFWGTAEKVIPELIARGIKP